MSGKCPKELETEFITDVESGIPVPALCDKYNRCRSTIRDWRLGLYHQGKILWWPNIPYGEVLEYNDNIVVEGDAVVIGDLEIPYHDPQTIGYALSVGRSFRISNLVIAGDFLANDAVGYFAGKIEDTDDSVTYTLADGLEEGKAILEELFQHFSKIAVIKGNHEARAARVREMGFFRMMEKRWEELGDLELSFYKWCEVRSGGETFRIEHPGNYSKVPGSVVRDRAEIEHSHVLAGHTHHLSLSFTKTGKHLAGDLGHCTRPRARYYKAVDGTTRHPKWNRGFWMIRNGYAYPFAVDFTDWDFWLREVKVSRRKKR
jgi:hypothetical protein